MEEVPKPESLNIPPPTKHHEDLYMDTGKDPDPPEPPRLITAPAPPEKKPIRTKTTKYAPSVTGLGAALELVPM
jgi:hypothetical protein